MIPEEPDLEDGDGLQTDAEVACPYCGETVTIALDPGGGSDQRYVEDCEVCCRPWDVRVRYQEGGWTSVELDVLD